MSYLKNTLECLASCHQVKLRTPWYPFHLAGESIWKVMPTPTQSFLPSRLALICPNSQHLKMGNQGTCPDYSLHPEPFVLIHSNHSNG